MYTRPLAQSSIRLDDGGASLRAGLERAVVLTRPVKQTSVYSDEQLIRAIAGGDSLALEELVNRYEKPIWRFVYRMLGSREDAEDVALDLFVRVWRYAGQFRFRASVSTWLYRIAGNLARNVHHRRATQPTPTAWPEENELEHEFCASAEQDAIEALEARRRAAALRAGLQRLSSGDRLILVLYYLEDREYAEIQEVVGVSYEVLKVRLARARRRLRTRMCQAGCVG